MVGLTVAALALSSLITGMSYEEFGENAMVFVAPYLLYPVLTAVMGLLRLFLAPR